MSDKFYVAIYKNKSYVFEQWNECKNFIDNKDDVRFKSFTSMEDAKKFVDANIKKQVSLQNVPIIYPYGFLFEKDGKKVLSYSFIVEFNNDVIFKKTKYNNKPFSNYPAELYSVIEALELLIENHYNHAIIAYNFLGIEMWTNGSWKPKNKNIENYVKKMQTLKSKINYDFLHIDKEIISEKRKREA